MGCFKVSSIWVLDTGDFGGQQCIFGWCTALDYFSKIFYTTMCCSINVHQFNGTTLQFISGLTRRREQGAIQLDCIVEHDDLVPSTRYLYTNVHNL